jgi:pilus assembly protein CpaE
VVAAPFGPTALAKAHASGLIVVDRVEGATDAVDVVRRIKSAPDIGAVPLLAIAQGDDVDERVRLLEAGADDVVSRPVDPLELQLRMDALLIRAPEPAPRPEHVLAVVPDRERMPSATLAFLSPKGGAGTTTAAVNVAVTLARGGRSVALIDLDLSFGAVAMHLDIRPRFSIVDAVRDDLALDDPEVLRQYATVADGLAVFTAPLTPDQAELVTGEHLRRLLAVAAAAFDVTVVDLGSAFDERVLTVVGLADRVAILTTPEIPALRSVRALMEALAEYAESSRHVFVLNHLFPADMLTRDEVRTALGDSHLLELPYAQAAYHRAVNNGVPVVTGAPRSEAAAGLVRLTAALMGDPAGELVGGDRRLRLAGLLRRG